LKNDVNIPSKINTQKNLVLFILKVNDENSRIMIRIQTKMSWIRNTAKKHEFFRGTWLDANAVGEQGLTGRYGDCGGRRGS
jgi:hypothetical protein